MFNLTKFAVPAMVAGALIVSTGAAFAVPTFNVEPAGNGMPIDEFESQLAAFNKADVTDLVGAKTVSVIKYDTAWDFQHGAKKSIELLTKDSQTIGLLREAIKANPDAVNILDANKIAITNVVDIVSDGHGAVFLYVS